MASEAPSAVDVTDIQFKVNSKFNLLKQDVKENKGNLVAAASVYGLVIVGSPSEPCLKVLQLSRIVSDKEKHEIPSREIQLAAAPYAIALSCDHSMLAVNFKQNDSAFVTIFSVPSFLSANVKAIHQQLRLCADDGLNASQLLWNPVLPNTLAVCLSNKSLLVFAFKEQGYDFYSIDKAEQVGCASWSPKGKQIVAGFPNGKIAQYKPDLKLARTIPCTVRLFNAAWEVIALQWLSTYQFAAIMLSKEENACPNLFIVYAPKNGSPTYTNYSDVCYSQPGPRSAQVILNHILPWNLLLVVSANGTEVGVLGTSDTGDNPLWKQYLMPDEARAELPLHNHNETFALGIDIDTGTTHHLVINESQVPVMAMLHMLSTSGVLISFNMLNTTPNCPSINSPPQSVADSSGLSSFALTVPTATTTATVTNTSPPKNDISFGFPAAATSTPRAPQKAAPTSLINDPPKTETPKFFQSTSSVEQSKPFPSLFGGQTTIQPISSAPSAFSFVPKPTETATVVPLSSQPSQGSLFGATKPQIPTVVPSKPSATVDALPKLDTKPFITVPATFTQAATPNATEKPTKVQSNDESQISDDDIIRKMIREEIQSYESLAKTFLQRCKGLEVTVGSKDESKRMLKELMELQDISSQATESTDALALDIQALKVSLNETYLMIAELKSKHSLLNDSSYTQLNDANAMSHTSRRQLEKLEKLLAVNENQFRIVSQQINAHWSSYEEDKTKTRRAKMHVPTLENIYQTLTKQRDIISRQRIKINHIKSRLGYKDTVNPSKKTPEINISSLTDSMVSMSLCDQVKLDTERLSTDKLNSLRDMLKSRKILQIIPKRPERQGLSSEIVIEKRKAQEKKKVEALTKVAQTTAASHQSVTQTTTANDPMKFDMKGLLPPKSTSQSEPVGLLKLGKATAQVAISKDAADAVKNAPGPVKEVKSKPETIGFGSQLIDKPAPEGIAAPFSSKPAATIGIASGNGKPAAPFGGVGLFNNLGSKSFGTINNSSQQSPLFGSTPTPFGALNAAPVPKKLEAASKPSDKAPSIFDVKSIATPATPKSADKENAPKIEIPKPVLGGVVQDKVDVMQKPATIQTGLSSFGIASSATASTAAATGLSFGSLTTSKSSSALFGAIPPAQDTLKPTISSSSIVAVKPNPATVSVAAPVSSSTSAEFSFSLDKMGITPKATPTPTENAFQKPLFNLDPKTVPPPVAATPLSTGSADATDKLLENLTVCQPTPTDKDKAAATGGGNIFSMSSFTTPTKSENPSSIFGGNAAAAATAAPFSSFGNLAATISTTPATPTTQTSVFATPFSSPNVTVTSASAPSTGLFGKPAEQSSPFGQQQKPSSIFGGGATSAATTQLTSVFGGTAAATTATTPSTSVFGGNAFETPSSSAATPFGATATPSNAFGTPTSNAFGSSSTSSNIFGGSAGFGSPGGNAGNAFGSAAKSIFGGGAAAATPEQATSTFGSSGGSIFGAANAASPASPFGQTAAQSTGSMFGGSSFGSAAAQPSTGSIFGGASATPAAGFGQSTFGSSSFSQQSSPFGAFSQPAATTGFGSSNIAQPTFGGQPTFGAAATFGSPKSGFGSFATNTFGAAPTQQNSLFETLGSSDTGLSFGNIAQNSNANTPKSSFGGGSFSTWR